MSCSKWDQKIIATNTNSSLKSFALYNSDYGMAQWEVVGPFAYVNGAASGFDVPERISNVAMNRNGSHWFATTSTVWNEWYYSTRKPVSVFSLQSTPETADAMHVFTTSQSGSDGDSIGGVGERMLSRNGLGGQQPGTGFSYNSVLARARSPFRTEYAQLPRLPPPTETPAFTLFPSSSPLPLSSSPSRLFHV